jgi:hypothetical protein
MLFDIGLHALNGIYGFPAIHGLASGCTDTTRSYDALDRDCDSFHDVDYNFVGFVRCSSMIGATGI